MARDAVFRSWNGKRAITYRRMNQIPDNLGTAVNVQTMCSETGRYFRTGWFTRIITGEKLSMASILGNAQGEDVVAGIALRWILRSSKSDAPVYNQLRESPQSGKTLPGRSKVFESRCRTVALHAATRNGKRTGPAAVRIAVDMVNEKVISKKSRAARGTAAARSASASCARSGG